jgi:hypothetical protein
MSSQPQTALSIQKKILGIHLAITLFWFKYIGEKCDIMSFVQRTKAVQPVFQIKSNNVTIFPFSYSMFDGNLVTLSEKPIMQFCRAKFLLQNSLCHIGSQYKHFEICPSTFSSWFTILYQIKDHNHRQRIKTISCTSCFPWRKIGETTRSYRFPWKIYLVLPRTIIPPFLNKQQQKF